MEKQKVCPVMGKCCYEDNCGWYSSNEGKCAVASIGDNMWFLMMSLTGEYSDNPTVRITEATECIMNTLEDLNETVGSISSSI